MRCSYCGAQNPDDAKFCGDCGRNLSDGRPAPPALGPGVTGRVGVPHIPDYLLQAILVTLFCCVPFGVVSIAYAAQVNGMVAGGNIQGAVRASADARKWAWISFWVGLAAYVGGVLVWLVIAAAAISSEAS